MSRDPWPRPADDSLHLIADAAVRIADTLDDYMSMSIAGLATTTAMQATDPRLDALLRPLTDALREIVDRRAAR